jgi:4-aminobutyrate aminotransferase-like enzyme
VTLQSRNTRPRRGIDFAGGSGATFWSSDGRRFVDFSSQTMNALFGQAQATIAAAVCEQVRSFTFADQDFVSAQHEAAAADLTALLPRDLEIVNLRLNDGSDAVECAIKQCRKSRGRGRILTVDGIYLGQTTQTLGIRGWGPRRDEILVGSSEDVVFAPLPYCFGEHDPVTCGAANGDAIVALLRDHADELACVVLDPVMVSAGVCCADSLRTVVSRAVREARSLGVPVVLDESQSYGWVPEVTLARHWELGVDALVLGKGVAGGFPLAACVFKRSLDNLEWGDADFTNGGHPASIAALRAACRLIAEGRDAFDQLVRLIDELLGEQVARRDDVHTHGVGLIRAIELRIAPDRARNAELAREVVARALDQGVYLRPYGPTLGLKPPRIISPEELRDGLETLFQIIDDVASEVGDARPHDAARRFQPA